MAVLVHETNHLIQLVMVKGMGFTGNDAGTHEALAYQQEYLWDKIGMRLYKEMKRRRKKAKSKK